MEKIICKNCKYWSSKDNGYCWLKRKPKVSESETCRRYGEISFDEHTKSDEFRYAESARKKDKERNSLILRIIELVLLFSLVLVTIIFGLINI